MYTCIILHDLRTLLILLVLNKTFGLIVCITNAQEHKQALLIHFYNI